MNNKPRAGARLPTLTLALVALISTGALWADDEDREGRFKMSHPAYLEECGGCHLAFPPQLLPASSWRALMERLEDHFGSDASLDETSRRAIGDFLQSNAGRGSVRDDRGEPLLRITETPWFLREHRAGEHGLTAGIFESEAVRSPANCAACHRGAAAGNYGEHDIRIPGGRGR